MLDTLPRVDLQLKIVISLERECEMEIQERKNIYLSGLNDMQSLNKQQKKVK